MFNVYCMNGKDLIIYNTFQGLRSIKIVPFKNIPVIKDWLNGDFSNLCDNYSFLFNSFRKYGYIVDKDVDESLRRSILYAENLMSNRLELVIHVTKNCNFRCTYCGLNFSNEYMSIDTQKAVIKYVQQNISKFSSVHINWFGGEPLLNMSVIENISKSLILICKKAHKPFSANITTNGYLLNPDNINLLLQCKVSKIIVTIDGIKETHDKTRIMKNKTQTFDKIINNLIYIRDNVKTHSIQIIIRTNLTVSMINRVYLKKYYHFYDNTFGCDNRFQLFIRPVRDWGGESVKAIHNDLLETYGLNMGGVYSYLSTLIKNIKFGGNIMDLYPGGITCPGKRVNKFTITTEGLINKCDNAAINLSVGELYNNGQINLSEGQNRWLVNTQNNKKCKCCALSCLCFMDGCPKSRIESGITSCAIDVEEVYGLLKLFVASYTVESLEL